MYICCLEIEKIVNFELTTSMYEYWYFQMISYEFKNTTWIIHVDEYIEDDGNMHSNNLMLNSCVSMKIRFFITKILDFIIRATIYLGHSGSKSDVDENIEDDGNMHSNNLMLNVPRINLVSLVFFPP
ncbi:hypothetical protein ACJX0J_037153 [Zea mays]